MEKHIFRVIFKLGFALITIALKHSRRKDDLIHLKEFEYMMYKIPDLTECISKNDPVVLLNHNGPDICDYIHVHFPHALEEEKTSRAKKR